MVTIRYKRRLADVCIEETSSDVDGGAECSEIRGRKHQRLFWNQFSDTRNPSTRESLTSMMNLSHANKLSSCLRSSIWISTWLIYHFLQTSSSPQAYYLWDIDYILTLSSLSLSEGRRKTQYKVTIRKNSLVFRSPRMMGNFSLKWHRPMRTKRCSLQHNIFVRHIFTRYTQIYSSFYTGIYSAKFMWGSLEPAHHAAPCSPERDRTTKLDYIFTPLKKWVQKDESHKTQSPSPSDRGSSMPQYCFSELYTTRNTHPPPPNASPQSYLRA